MEDVDGQLRRLLAVASYGEALALLHRAYAQDVVRFVRSQGASTSVEDLCQEVWLAARRALPRFRFESMPRTWLFGIARRRFLDRRRQATRGKPFPLPSSVDGLERVFLQSGRWPPSTPSSDLRRKRRATALKAELAQLRPGDRELVELRFIEGLSPAEIVEVLGLETAPNAVSQRLLRLVRKLRERLLARAGFENR